MTFSFLLCFKRLISAQGNRDMKEIARDVSSAARNTGRLSEDLISFQLKPNEMGTVVNATQSI